MWSAILITLVTCGASPENSERAPDAVVRTQSAFGSIQSEPMLYGYTPTRWRKWPRADSLVQIEAHVQGAGEQLPRVAVEPAQAILTGDRDRSVQRNPTEPTDDPDAPAMKQVAGSRSLVAQPLRPVVKSVPPGRFLDLEQLAPPETSDSREGTKPVCQANRAAVLAQTPPHRLCLLTPTFPEAALNQEDE